jgi:hypothetical protein
MSKEHHGKKKSDKSNPVFTAKEKKANKQAKKNDKMNEGKIVHP